ncbi:MAG TPA: hypothetical protein PK156_30680, partial [Polyangium sp.]|nr:hypothetical protein [Polyangium sp.]
MTSSNLTHDIVCVGSHEPLQHEFHAANARALADLFAGGLGPGSAVIECLVGPNVTVSDVWDLFDAAQARAATNLVVYFSGFGGSAGLQLADGVLEAEPLVRYFLRSPAENVLVILDLAIGTAPDDALLPDWLRTLATNRPGFRVAVARATRIGAGAAGEGLGRFTSALISVLESSSGDLRVDRRSFISDKRAMEQAHVVLEQRWGLTEFPFELGTFGDVALTRSQASVQIGQASIVKLTHGAGLSVSVNWVLEGRANMPTTLRYELVRPDGTVSTEGDVVLVPKNPLQKGKTHLRIS